MRKISDFFKKNRKNIFIIIAVTFLVFFCSNFIFAAINSESVELKANSEGDGLGGFFASILDKILNIVGSIASGTILKLIGSLIGALAGLMFILVVLIWGVLGGSVMNLPFPDRIIFNQMSLFDPNFINPTPFSELQDFAVNFNFINLIQGVASNIYFTFFIVAGLIMVIAAMVIGIKLAISSIAIEKAQYKELLNKWLIGIVVLFCLHFFILGAFTLNEKICEIASTIAGNNSVNFDFTDMSIVTKAAGALKGFFNWVTGNGDAANSNRLVLQLSGYGGLLMYLMLSVSFSGDLICAIALLALIGQMLNLIFQYFKRFIFVIFLAIISPLVVAVDIIKRAL